VNPTGSNHTAERPCNLRVSRSSLVTIQVSPARQAARANSDLDGRRWCRLAVIDIDPIITDTERVQLRWEVRSCCSVDTRAYPTRSSFITCDDADHRRAFKFHGEGPQAGPSMTAWTQQPPRWSRAATVSRG
jgi:hypothetical protein